MINKIWQIVLNIGSIAGLLALVYTIFASLRRRPKFKFVSYHRSGRVIEINGVKYQRFEFTGFIKNQSLDPNTLIRVYLVVWANRRNNATLRFSCSGLKIFDNSNKEISLPIRFLPKEAVELKIVFEFEYSGIDKKLIEAVIPFKPSSTTLVYKYEYQLAFEDINENYFDQRGRLININEKNLRWTLSNAFKDYQQGNVKSFIKHRIKIVFAKILFKLKTLFQSLGIWK